MSTNNLIISIIKVFKDGLIDYLRKHCHEAIEKSNGNEDIKRKLSVIMEDAERDMTRIVGDYERDMSVIEVQNKCT